MRGANIGVQFFDLKDLYNHYLFTDIIRADRPYTYNPDINGNFLITALDADNLAIEADYTVLHFSIQHPEMLNDKSIMCMGILIITQLPKTQKWRLIPEQDITKPI